MIGSLNSSRDSYVLVGSDGEERKVKSWDSDLFSSSSSLLLTGSPLVNEIREEEEEEKRILLKDGKKAEDVISFLAKVAENEEDYDEKERKLANETILFWNDRCNRHTIFTILFQLIASGFQTFAAFSHLKGEKNGIGLYVGNIIIRTLLTPPAVFGTILSHTTDSLESTDRLLLKSRSHIDFWGHLRHWWSRVLLTLVAIFICFSALVGDANRTWRENHSDPRYLQLFWTVYNTLLSLPLTLWGTVDFLCLFINKYLDKWSGNHRPSEEQLDLLSQWVENMDEATLFSGIAFDRRQWPQYKKKKKDSMTSSLLFWTIHRYFFTLIALIMLLVATFIKIESSQEGLSEFFALPTSIIVSIISQISYVTLSAKWPYRSFMLPFLLMKRKCESSNMLRVHYPVVFGVLYFFLLTCGTLAIFGAFYSGLKILKLPSSLDFLEGFIIHTFGIHYIFYATGAGFAFFSRVFEYVRELRWFDPQGVYRFRAATKQAILEIATPDDFL